MTPFTKKLIIALIFIFSFISAAQVVYGQTIGTLDQFVATTTPSTAITQRSFGRAIKVTGLTAGQFLKLDSNNIMTTGAVSITGAGIDNFNPLLPIIAGLTSGANLQTASSTLYLNIGGVLTPIFTATSTGSYFIAGSIPISTFGGSADYCFGESSCSHITSAQNTIAIGQDALTSVTSLSGNVGIGKNSLFFTTGAGNTATGFAAGAGNISGATNCYYGFGADTLGTAFSNSCAIGENSLIGQSNFMALGGPAPDNEKVGIATSTSWNTADLTINQLAGEDGLFIGSSTASLVVDRNGKVGIGTSTPGSIFSIAGVANFTTATSSLYGNGIDLKNGCFSIAGVCVGGSGGGGSGTVNSGLLGQTAYYAANGTAVSGTSTIFTSTASNVGIGTTLPTVKLQVVGGEIVLSDGAVTGTVGNGNFSITGSAGSFNVFKRGVTNLASTVAGDRWAQYADASGFHTFTGTTGDTNIITPGGNWVLNFKEGIGGVTPNTPLDVAGTTTIRTIDALATTYATREAGLLFARSDVPTTFTNAITNSINGAPTSQTMNFEVGNGANTRATVMTLNGSGNVGINNTNPARDEFQVSGDIEIGTQRFGSGYSEIYLNGQSNTSYNFLSSNGDENLYINRPTGNSINFRSQNVDQMILNSSGFLGIGSTSPSAALSVQTNSTSVIPFAVATSTGGTLFYIDAKGNQYVGGDKPTFGVCGTNPSLAAGSNNNAGRITAGTGLVTACTIIFADAGWTTTGNAPVCWADDESGGSVTLETAPSQTSLVITGSTFTGHAVSYRCTGF